MHLAIIGNYPLDKTHIQGGVQAAFAYLVNGLSQIEGLQVHVLTMVSGYSTEQERIERNGIILHILPTYPRFEFARNYGTYQSRLNAKLAQIQPDVVHAQESTTHAYVALRSGYPTVVTVHGIQREDLKYLGGSLLHRLRNRLHNWLIEGYTLKHARHLIAISRYVVTYFSKQLRPDVQVYHIPNAIDQYFFNLPNSGNGHTILFAGRIIARKRVLDLIRAFAKITRQDPLAQLRLAGEYKSEPVYAEAIQNFIYEANLTSRVHLLGPLTEEAIWREFANCDVLVLPSAQETTPMVIAQAMAAGKPVLATPVGGVAEMVRANETGLLVQVGDIDGLAEALRCLLQDTALRTCMGQMARQFALENYHADAVAKRTYEVYQTIAMA